MAVQGRSRHRAPARQLGRWLVPSGASLFVWLAENTPGGAAGFLGLVGTGFLVSLCYPLLALMAVEAPGGLVPASWRVWWRKDQEYRPAIGKRLRRVVYAADRHACAYCGKSFDLNIDHVRPWSLGGRTCLWNCMTLCGTCNRTKSNYWVHRDGRVTYRAFEGCYAPAGAAKILAFELRHRWSVIRFIRAALAL